MARLAAPRPFEPEQWRRPVIGIHARLEDHDSGTHAHAMGQLLFAREGCVRIQADEPALLCLLPPTRAAWIPAGLPHRALMRRPVEYRSVYFDPADFPGLPPALRILSVGALLRELLERVCQAPFATDWQQGAAAHLAGLCVAEIAAAPAEPLMLALPRDRRLRRLAEGEGPPPLRALARHAGASERTLSRLIQRETGLTYRQWRRQWQLMRAVELLDAQCRLDEIALELGFGSDSAFIAFFREMTGTTPSRWRRKGA